MTLSETDASETVGDFLFLRVLCGVDIVLSDWMSPLPPLRPRARANFCGDARTTSNSYGFAIIIQLRRQRIPSVKNVMSVVD